MIVYGRPHNVGCEDIGSVVLQPAQSDYLGMTPEIGAFVYEEDGSVSGLFSKVKKKIKKAVKGVAKAPKKLVKSAKKGIKTIVRFGKNHGGEVLQAAGPLLGGPLGMAAGGFGGLFGKRQKQPQYLPDEGGGGGGGVQEAGIDPKILLLGGAGLVAVLLLRRK